MKARTQEHSRLEETRTAKVPWRKWGPYLSERQWGTVREDYSHNGDAWNYFTHDQARSRAYRWGEDGIAGICDEEMRLCFSLALWNGKDPILKERMFGLTNGEGNHGEDVKEYYFYLDSTPTHSYMKMLYKYPQAAFPYDQLVKVNRSRTKNEFEFELLDTGVFNEDKYFDIFVEYAKASPEDILIRITAVNRGPEKAPLHLLPHLWFRNTWLGDTKRTIPFLRQNINTNGVATVIASHPELGERFLYCEHPDDVLFTNNETNTQRLCGVASPNTYVKDGINDYIVQGNVDAVNPRRQGTKAAAHYKLLIGPGESKTVRLRLTDTRLNDYRTAIGSDFDAIFDSRQREADEFYEAVIPRATTPDAINVVRQSYAGMLWSKQTYIYAVNKWLEEHGVTGNDGPVPIRNSKWSHLTNQDIISMPDKWEYPWFAAWDLAFHTINFSFIDPDFAHKQLELMLRERYMHPNGQIPAYEWNFGDVNPPVHAWASLFSYRLARDILGGASLELLKKTFNKLLLNFSWWVNRKDRDGRNVFEGGFLGLDNIGVFDRSSPLPTGGSLEQADGTAWMAFYSQNMLSIAIELAMEDPTYEDIAVKFYEHFIWIASAVDKIGPRNDSMWDEEDGFFYDLLRFPNGDATRLRVRSMVGLLPLCAVSVYPSAVGTRLHQFAERVAWFNRFRPDLLKHLNPPGRPGVNGRYMLALMNDDKLRRVLSRLLDPNEFLSDYGIRSLSRYHLQHPYIFHVGPQEYRVDYLPAESNSGMFGGNSNWRGPIWMPVNVMIVRALLQMYTYYGNEFRVECPTGSGIWMNLYEVARDISSRLSKIFLRDKKGKRGVYGGTEKFQNDPYWRDYIPFYEYFHGDNGAGLGASHQTGWTGLIAPLIHIFNVLKPEDLLEKGGAGFFEAEREAHQKGRSRPVLADVEAENKVFSKTGTRGGAKKELSGKTRSQRLRGK